MYELFMLLANGEIKKSTKNETNLDNKLFFGLSIT